VEETQNNAVISNLNYGVDTNVTGHIHAHMNALCLFDQSQCRHVMGGGGTKQRCHITWNDGTVLNSGVDTDVTCHMHPHMNTLCLLH